MILKVKYNEYIRYITANIQVKYVIGLVALVMRLTNGKKRMSIKGTMLALGMYSAPLMNNSSGVHIEFEKQI
ncbi:MAG: hypothetical protein HUJ68_09745 [Clostridia bacterium]|nr:hypothetical protein [Clostridia bacterium]